MERIDAAQGDADEAKQSFEIALAMYEKAFGTPNRPEVSNLLESYAATLQGAKHQQEVNSLLARTKAIRAAINADDQPSPLSSELQVTEKTTNGQRRPLRWANHAARQRSFDM